VQSATRTFSASPASVGAARRFASATLSLWRRTEMVDDVRSAVSELATNAALHAATDFTVTLTLNGSTLRMSVTDGSQRQPRMPRHEDPQSTTGRGLRMIALMATGWGVEPLASGGKTVWCEFAAVAGSDEPDRDRDGEDRADARGRHYLREPQGTTSARPHGTYGFAGGSVVRAWHAAAA
jgi:anti-sigma regulatory factor (Ser/Thr protein kinase)